MPGDLKEYWHVASGVDIDLRWEVSIAQTCCCLLLPMRDTTGVDDMEWPEFAQGYYSDDEEEAALERRDEMMEEVTRGTIGSMIVDMHALVNHYNSAKVEGHVYWRNPPFKIKKGGRWGEGA